MKYVIVDGVVEWPIQKITVAQMNDVLLRPGNKEIVGLPCYYDDNGRVFPKPDRGMEIKERTQ